MKKTLQIVVVADTEEDVPFMELMRAIDVEIRSAAYYFEIVGGIQIAAQPELTEMKRGYSCDD